VTSELEANQDISLIKIGAKSDTPVDEARLLRQLQASVRPTQLAQRTVWPTLGAIAGNWIVIASCIAALAFLPWYLQPVWLLLIAARQHALLVLMHDGSHFLICRSKAYNDLISDLFCCFPFGIATRTYRANHISHHEHLNTSDDPDLVRTVGPAAHPQEWLFPMPHRRLFGFFVRDLFGRGFLYLITTLTELIRNGRASKQSRCEYRWPALLRGAYLAAVAVLLNMSHKPWLILYGWALPMFVVLPLLLRLRALAEHFALPRNHVLGGTRTVQPPWWERVLIAPHNISLHLEHHLFPYVPWFLLPELHNRLMQVDVYRANARVNGGYLSGRNSLLTDVANVGDDPRVALANQKGPHVKGATRLTKWEWNSTPEQQEGDPAASLPKQSR
jgi:fatty acid desaturase